jgi:DNA-binding Xre family transcriptional regulator
MKLKGISSYRLEKMGFSRTNYYSIKKGNAINTTTIDTLCRLLDCSVSEIMEYVPDDIDDNTDNTDITITSYTTNMDNNNISDGTDIPSIVDIADIFTGCSDIPDDTGYTDISDDTDIPDDNNIPDTPDDTDNGYNN